MEETVSVEGGRRVFSLSLSEHPPGESGGTGGQGSATLRGTRPTEEFSPHVLLPLEHLVTEFYIGSRVRHSTPLPDSVTPTRNL